MLTDIEIARSVTLKHIEEIAFSLGIGGEDIEQYGKYKAKVMPKDGGNGSLILVTAINPTAAGEGKTTVSIGLADGLKRIGKKVSLALREPSLGPVFGIKGGATGGGYAQIAPMEDINLHFTGDMHAITSANNLLSSLIDNHIYWGNALKIKKVLFHRCMDLNDRALRNAVVGLNYNVREDKFDITAASEVMAVLCISKDETELKKNLGNIIIGVTGGGDGFIRAKDLGAQEAMAILLKDAIKPNLVQTLEGVPAFVHGGPFANIAHGCNSIIATRTALHYSDYVVTEAGFGADLGAEKFFDIKCRKAGLDPKAVVVVATVRALKCAGGSKDLKKEDMDSLTRGMENLYKHIENMTRVFKKNCVVAINKFSTDTDREIGVVLEGVAKIGFSAVLCEGWEKGGAGCEALAREVVSAAEKAQNKLEYAYADTDSIEEKIRKVAVKIYGADGVDFTETAKKSLALLKGTEAESAPVCIAKTQYSLSDNAALIGRPKNFRITVKDAVYRGGAGFTVAVAGEILLMPGLNAQPNAMNMEISDGIIKGLF